MEGTGPVVAGTVVAGTVVAGVDVTTVEDDEPGVGDAQAPSAATTARARATGRGGDTSRE